MHACKARCPDLPHACMQPSHYLQLRLRVPFQTRGVHIEAVPPRRAQDLAMGLSAGWLGAGVCTMRYGRCEGVGSVTVRNFWLFLHFRRWGRRLLLLER